MRFAWVPRVFAALIAPVLLAGGGCTAGPRQTYVVESAYGIDDPQFRREMSAVFGPPLVGGNAAVELVNGDQIFPAMLEAIRGAERTVTFETYIFWSGQIGRLFADALAERARAGVRVHVLIDAIGSRDIAGADVRRMERAGVEVESYHPWVWHDPSSLLRLNNRTHRRLLVVDGDVAFTGGAAVGDVWLGDARDRHEWRDTHYRFEGPVVAQLQGAFTENWLEARGTLLQGDGYFPALETRGTAVAQAVRASAAEDVRSVRLMYLMAIASARTHVRIACAYFVPDRPLLDALRAARRRGVEVDVIMPGDIMDVPVVRSASRATWGHLFRAGVRVHEYQPAMYHCKVLIVDDLFVSVGSANFDERSYSLNDEANVNVLDEAFAARQIELFEQDLTQSKQITHDAWRRRPVIERILDGFATLLSPQL